MPIRFDQLASAPARSLQIYLILIGCAANQQVITYGRLADRAGVLTPTWLFACLFRPPPFQSASAWPHRRRSHF